MAYGLLQGDRMKAQRCSQAVDRKREEQTVLVIGGSGGMSSRYRDVVEKHGWSLRHYENRVPPGARHGAGKVALIVIMVTMVSHALRDQMQTLATDGAPVVYLRSASVSALRAALEQRVALEQRAA
ncbi:DUF2325 domain-containing protein [Sorangium sp. So ce834]|uniref:DUF2325 domain-containing protein n=1 Tax=Sorangium sp. So ce834 TaxID=3133321 RepID=UPI003F619E96